ncbi:MAG: HAD-IB family phosphatase [Bacteroidia bacterium]|nr:HAD-IB family phosphatase [Bacteroidia bacterium]
MSKTLVLFDFDGTLTKSDTFPQFIFFSQGYFKGIMGFIIFSPLIFLFFIKVLSGDTLKEKMISFYFMGQSKDVLRAKGESFIQNLIKLEEFNTSLIQKLAKAKMEGSDVCIVSASLDIWIEPFCKKHGIEYLCTELNFINGISTGKLETPNCNRAEKAVRIKQKYNLSDYSKIIAYGNSSGDKAMFDLANETHLVKNG